MRTRAATLLVGLLGCVLLLTTIACGTSNPTPTASNRTPTPTPTAGGQPSETPTPTSEPTVDLTEHFSGKTITFLVGFAPGGGYDVYARLLALHWPQYIPGNPRILVRNLPGAGGLRGLQELVRSPGNGLFIGYAHPRWINQALLYDDVENFKIEDITPVGVPSSTESTYTYFVDKAVAGSLEEVLARTSPLNMGQTEPVGPGYPNNAIWREIGAPLNVIYGFGGTTEIAAGLDRGELQVGYRIPSTMHLYPEWISEARWIPIFYNGAPPSVDPQVMEYLEQTGQADANPPHLYEAFNVSPEMREYMDLGLAMFLSFSRTVVIPSDTPGDITQAIRDSFRQTVEDPEFIAAAELTGERPGYGDPETLEELLSGARQLLSDPQRLQKFLSLAD